MLHPCCVPHVKITWTHASMCLHGNYRKIINSERRLHFKIRLSFGKNSVKINNTFKLEAIGNFVPFIQYVKQILTAFYSGHRLKL